MTAYQRWLEALVLAHRRRQGHGARYTGCWVCDVLAPGAAEIHRCRELSAGILDGHHVLPKQLLKREFPRGAVEVHWDGGGVGWGRDPGLPPYRPEAGVTPAPRRSLEELLWDPRVGVPVRRWHHDQWENARLSVPRASLPAEVETFAEEVGLQWWIERSFGG
jgi:hypothetical protein